MNVDPCAARLRFDHFELDEAEARLTCAGQPVPLAPKPFAVLCALARTPRMLVTKNALLDAVWGHRFVTESVLKSAISRATSRRYRAAVIASSPPRPARSRRSPARWKPSCRCAAATRRSPISSARSLPRSSASVSCSTIPDAGSLA